MENPEHQKEKGGKFFPHEEFLVRQIKKEIEKDREPKQPPPHHEGGDVTSLHEFKNAKARKSLRKLFNLPPGASDEELMGAIEEHKRKQAGFPPDWTEEDIDEALKRIEFQKPEEPPSK